MISLLCPTRKRAENFRRFVNSARSLATNQFEVVTYQDNDDQTLISGANKVIRGPRLVLSDYWNKLAAEATGDIMMLCGDDLVFKTRGWDVILQAAFDSCPDKILYAYGDDGTPNAKNFGTHGAIHRKWYETLGRYTHHNFGMDFADCWVMEIAKMINRAKFIPILTEHLHPVFGKAKMDETYSYKQKFRPATVQLYDSLLEERRSEAEKLRAVMDPAWMIS